MKSWATSRRNREHVAWRRVFGPAGFEVHWRGPTSEDRFNKNSTPLREMLPWAQGVGRSNRPALTMKVKELPLITRTILV